MKTILRVVADISLFAMIYILVSILSALLFGAGSDYHFMLTMLVSVAVVLVLTGALERFRYRVTTPIMALRDGFDARAILWGVIFMVAVSVVISPLEALLPADRQSLPEGGWTMLTAVVIAPIFEELIFRGRLYNLLRHSCSPSVAVVLSALIFAVAHGSVVVGISAFLSGVIFGYFYLLKRSIIAPIILHICNNAVAYALIVLSYQDKSLQELIGTSNGYFVIYAASLVVAALGLMHLVKTLYCADHPKTEQVE